MAKRSNRVVVGGRHEVFIRAVRFTSLALALLVLCFYGLARVQAVDQTVVQPYLTALAEVTGFALRTGGFNNFVSGHQIHSDRFTAEVDPTCGALELMAVFVAVTLPFPVNLRRRLGGLCVGLVLILLANILRIGILFIVGSTHPSMLDAAHYGYGQAFLLLVAMGIWIAWVRNASAEDR
jgi:exosortase/archaeosortase family protein